jgi:hypothetical protein
MFRCQRRLWLGNTYRVARPMPDQNPAVATVIIGWIIAFMAWPLLPEHRHRLCPGACGYLRKDNGFPAACGELKNRRLVARDVAVPQRDNAVLLIWSEFQMMRPFGEGAA